MEGRIRSWKEKCKKLEERNKELANKILNNSKEQQEALQFLVDEKNSLADRCTSLTEKIQAMDSEFQRLQQELTKKNEEVQKLKENGALLAKQRQESGSSSSAARRSSNLFMKSRTTGPITIIEEAVNGTRRENGDDDHNNPEMVLISKPEAYRRLSSPQTEAIPIDGVQKRATFSASTMSRSRGLEVRSKASRISYIMKNTSEPDRDVCTFIIIFFSKPV